MLDRRSSARNANATRREFWNHKRAEADRRDAMDKAADAESVSDWLVRFQMARNNLCA